MDGLGAPSFAAELVPALPAVAIVVAAPAMPATAGWVIPPDAPCPALAVDAVPGAPPEVLMLPAAADGCAVVAGVPEAGADVPPLLAVLDGTVAPPELPLLVAPLEVSGAPVAAFGCETSGPVCVPVPPPHAAIPSAPNSA